MKHKSLLELIEAGESVCRESESVCRESHSRATHIYIKMGPEMQVEGMVKTVLNPSGSGYLALINQGVLADTMPEIDSSYRYVRITDLLPKESAACDALRQYNPVFIVSTSPPKGIEAKAGHVMHVCIYRQEKLDRIPAALSGFVSLNGVILRKCGLKSLAGIEQVKVVNYIDFSENAIEDISGCESLESVTSCYLGQNNIREADGARLPPNVSLLDLAYNNVSRLQNFDSLRELSSLFLMGNPIDWNDESNKKLLQSLEAKGVKVYR